MPIQCRPLDSDKIMVFTLTGRMVPGEVEAAFETQVRATNYEPGWNVMVDLSKADMSQMAPEAVHRDAKHIAGMTKGTPHKLGFVTGDNVINVGPAKLVDAYLKSLGAAQLARTFPDQEACMTWLRAPWTDDERRTAEARSSSS